MEQFKEFFMKTLDIKEVDIKTYSPLVLAHIGDAVYDLIIRTKIVCDKNSQVNKLHKEATKYVSAISQCQIMKLIEPNLNERELEYYKRGKNAKPHTTAKNATLIEYKEATAFECLIGYLYLTGEFTRIIELVGLAISKMSVDNTTK